MSNKFNKMPIAVSKRTNQNLSSTYYGTHDFGRMDVVYCNTDIVPGDDINLKVDGFLRGAPMPSPTFGDVDIDIRVFFVPHRILTSSASADTTNGFSWDNFIGGVSTNYHPYVQFQSLANAVHALPSSGAVNGAIRDCKRLLSQIGFPAAFCNLATSAVLPTEFANCKYNLWSLAAYQRIWWDYYRDSSLIPEQQIRSYVPLLKAGSNGTNDVLTKFLSPRYACFRKDYFTTAKQTPQSGVQTIGAPISATYYLDDNHDAVLNGSINNAWYGTTDSTPGVTTLASAFGPRNEIMGDLSLPVQWLRAANALQTYLERNNLSGTRLMERFLARFGVAPSAIALDMAEYLGGSRSTLQIGDVTANNEEFGASFTPNNAFNTANSEGTSAGTLQGQLGGKCAATANSGNISYHAKEFGTLMVIQTIVPRVSYFQGYDKSMSRGTGNDRYEYFTPEMENIGYQPVYRRELIEGTDADNGNEVFGYVPRYQDYKFKKDVVAGDMILEGTSTGMDSWHLGRIFDPANPPSLNAAFTMITPQARLSLDRIFSIPGTLSQYDHFTSVIHTDCKITRPMSDNALPSLEEDTNEGKKIDIENGGVRM